MKKTTVGISAAIALCFAAWGLTCTQAKVTEFSIVVELSADGMKMECSKGCAWTKVTYSCKEPGTASVPCKARVDQTGVEGIK